MYDALNKGLRITGDIVGLMHSDDEFYDATVSKIVSIWTNHKQKGCMRDGIYVSNDEESV
jgi:glycosyltransferase